MLDWVPKFLMKNFGIVLIEFMVLFKFVGHFIILISNSLWFFRNIFFFEEAKMKYIITTKSPS